MDAFLNLTFLLSKINTDRSAEIYNIKKVRTREAKHRMIAKVVRSATTERGILREFSASIKPFADAAQLTAANHSQGRINDRIENQVSACQGILMSVLASVLPQDRPDVLDMHTLVATMFSDDRPHQTPKYNDQPLVLEGPQAINLLKGFYEIAVHLTSASKCVRFHRETTTSMGNTLRVLLSDGTNPDYRLYAREHQCSECARPLQVTYPHNFCPVCLARHENSSISSSQATIRDAEFGSQKDSMAFLSEKKVVPPTPTPTPEKKEEPPAQRTVATVIIPRHEEDFPEDFPAKPLVPCTEIVTPPRKPAPEIPPKKEKKVKTVSKSASQEAAELSPVSSKSKKSKKSEKSPKACPKKEKMSGISVRADPPTPEFATKGPPPIEEVTPKKKHHEEGL